MGQGLLRQEGTGRPKAPFRYWLPEREELMRPDGLDKEKLQAWSSRLLKEVGKRPEQIRNR